jgi:hypothetical protein
MEKKLEVLTRYLEGSIFYLYTIFLEQSQSPLPGNYGEDVGGPGPGTWKTVSSTFTPNSWSSPRGLYKVTVEREVGGPGPCTWRTVSSTFTPTSWSSPRGLYQVTMEK